MLDESIATRSWASMLKVDELADSPRIARLRRQARLLPADAVARVPETRPDNVVLHGDPRMPIACQAMNSAPFGLRVVGDIDLLTSRPRVAIVGSRTPTSPSAAVARQMAVELARAGVTIVSGLAIGIDGEAHRGALDAGGTTIAVLGGGTDRMHPARHRNLAHSIVEHGGAIVSEYAPWATPWPQRFRDRNRIIAGLADALVVVQARRNSGSMITVTCASNIGVEVFAVPGMVTDPIWDGSTELLRDGVNVAVDASAVLDYLGIERVPPPPGPMDGLLRSPRSVDDLVTMSELTVDEVVETLLDLQMAGIVTIADDGRYVATGEL
jgi:DNA processing protein